MSREMRTILMNSEVIAIDQDESATAGDRLRHDPSGAQLWARPLANGDKAARAHWIEPNRDRASFSSHGRPLTPCGRSLTSVGASLQRPLRRNARPASQRELLVAGARMAAERQRAGPRHLGAGGSGRAHGRLDGGAHCAAGRAIRAPHPRRRVNGTGRHTAIAGAMRSTLSCFRRRLADRTVTRWVVEEVAMIAP